MRMLRSIAVRNPASILRSLGSVAVLLALSAPARAQFPWAGARAMGMGGAEVAAVRDNSATWSNPAVLADLQGWEVQILAGLAAQNRNNLVGLGGRPLGAPLRRDRGGRRSGARSGAVGPHRQRGAAGHERGRLGGGRGRRLLEGLRALDRNGALRRHLPGGRPPAHRSGRGPRRRAGIQPDEPEPGRALGARGPARLRPQLLRRDAGGRRRGPLRFGSHVLRALRRLQLRLRQQRPRGSDPAGVRGQRGHDGQVHVRPGRAGRLRHREARRRRDGAQPAALLGRARARRARRRCRCRASSGAASPSTSCRF